MEPMTARQIADAVDGVWLNPRENAPAVAAVCTDSRRPEPDAPERPGRFAPLPASHGRLLPGRPLNPALPDARSLAVRRKNAPADAAYIALTAKSAAAYRQGVTSRGRFRLYPSPRSVIIPIKSPHAAPHMALLASNGASASRRQNAVQSTSPAVRREKNAPNTGTARKRPLSATAKSAAARARKQSCRRPEIPPLYLTFFPICSISFPSPAIPGFVPRY